MNLKAFTVYDEKAHAYITPFFMHHEGMALRTFMNMVNDPDHQFGLNPEDYTLYYIGEFDDMAGTLIPLPKEELGNGRYLKDKQETSEDG